MATAVLRTPTFRAPPLYPRTTTISTKPHKFPCVSFSRTPERHQTCPKRCRLRLLTWPKRLHKFLPLASSHGETTETQEKQEEEVQESELEDSTDGAISVGESTDAEEPVSAISAALQAYKEALANKDESRVSEIEAFLKSLEDEKINLGRKVATLSEELLYEKDRILRISADFDNFRKRTEREQLSLVTNAQGEVVENLLSVLDNFERAKSQIKVETEGEEKINNSYQSIYKQFIEILGSVGVIPVETIGKPFDPLLHEAIMREESTEYEEGVIIEEFRKGFKLGDRLLRPSMVKVSAGPGPAKLESTGPSEDPEGVSKSSEEEPEPAFVEGSETS